MKKKLVFGLVTTLMLAGIVSVTNVDHSPIAADQSDRGAVSKSIELTE
ncbi:hypothetical protein [Tuberibacillus sp. Marseille-P3662]|nr:hypothetical protein [Tuberibacillus sp. Marseille-P3662]